VTSIAIVFAGTAQKSSLAATATLRGDHDTPTPKPLATSLAGMEDVDIDTRVTANRTVIEVSGSRDVAVVVRSAGGERIYLPPDDFDEPVEDSPYASPYTSPYQSAGAREDDGTPYRGAVESTRGVVETVTGFRISHPEAVTEVDVYRPDETA
jgi:hypothetical protein